MSICISCEKEAKVIADDHLQEGLEFCMQCYLDYRAMQREQKELFKLRICWLCKTAELDPHDPYVDTCIHCQEGDST